MPKFVLPPAQRTLELLVFGVCQHAADPHDPQLARMRENIVVITKAKMFSQTAYLRTYRCIVLYVQSRSASDS